MRSPAEDRPSPEDEIRTHLTEFERFIVRAWDRGVGGKIGILLVYGAFASPFVFNVVAVSVVALFVWPLTSNVAEKLAVLAFLFVALNAIALQVSRTANSILFAYFVRRRRRRKKTPATPPVALPEEHESR